MTTSEERKEQLFLAQFTRSDQWPKVRRQFLKLHPRCAACGELKRNGRTVHHVKPFYLYPELELDESNLITLCEPAHHLLFGHLQKWTSYNIDVVTDALIWNGRIKSRPKWKEMR